MYELTIFKNQYDNKTHRRVSFDSWTKFVRTLNGLYHQRGKKGGADSSVLITPAVFEDGTTRSNKSVLHWGGFALVDVDDYVFSDGSLEESIREQFGEYEYVVYNTASSREDKPKFRIVFQLDEPVEHDNIKAFWYALNTELGELGDPQTKDLARMYYVPAQYPDAHSFFFTNSGSPINVAELMVKHPYHEKTGNTFLDRLPPTLASAVIEHRKNQLNNTDYRWTSYRDCPFWPRKLAANYMQISGEGWYRGMYNIMVAVAGKAYERGYPISAKQIEDLCREFDRDTGNWYESRPMNKEADRALEYIYRNG